jgi:hypothetical protein
MLVLKKGYEGVTCGKTRDGDERKVSIQDGRFMSLLIIFGSRT